MSNEPVSVYVHVPFCLTKCPYCDFASKGVGRPDEAVGDRYVAAVVREFEEAAAGLKGHLQSLYFGGGTPSLLTPSRIGGIVGVVLGAFGRPSGVEVTLEVNPETVTVDSLVGYRGAGINRLSIGVQSFDDGVLAALGRVHSASRGREAFKAARSAGFTNVGIDLIFGAPGQTMESWKETLAEAARLNPEHVSVYSMTIEESTPFARLHGGGRGLPEEAEQNAMHEAAARVLGAAGFRRYEISNFCREGFKSRHNEGYWTGRRYIGLGASAHSFDPSEGWGVRRWNIREAEPYMDSIERTGAAVAGGESLTRQEAAAEAVMLGLRRLDEGFDLDGFCARFGVEAKRSGRIEELKAASFLEIVGGRMRLTPGAVAVSDEVMASVLAALSA